LLAFHGALPRRTVRLTVVGDVREGHLMTEAGAPRSVRHDLSPRRSIGIFGGLTVVLCAPLWVLINATQTVNAAYIFGLMWMPGSRPFSPVASWDDR
jgi:hypothetical protein